MLAQMYSVKPFSKMIRTTFEIPYDPYDKNIVFSDGACDYLRALGVFFYRDEENQSAIVIQPDDDNPEPITERSGFIAFKQLVDLDRRTFIPLDWIRPTKQKIAKEGDAKAWLIFNAEKLVHWVTETQIKLG